MCIRVSPGDPPQICPATAGARGAIVLYDHRAVDDGARGGACSIHSGARSDERGALRRRHGGCMRLPVAAPFGRRGSHRAAGDDYRATPGAHARSSCACAGAEIATRPPIVGRRCGARRFVLTSRRRRQGAFEGPHGAARFSGLSAKTDLMLGAPALRRGSRFERTHAPPPRTAPAK